MIGLMRAVRCHACAPVAIALTLYFGVACTDHGDVGASSRSSESDPSLWRVGDEPVVSVGSVSGDGASQFSGVTGAVRDPTGRIHVGDVGSSQVRVFDSTGRFVHA